MKNEKVLKNVANEAKKTNVANEVISKFAENTTGLLLTSNGTKKATIYKENLFTEVNEKQKKSLRKKFRNMLLSLCTTLANEENKEKETKLIKAFNEFYSEVYKVNDYSLQSVCNENLSKEKKEILTKALAKAKK